MPPPPIAQPLHLRNLGRPDVRIRCHADAPDSLPKASSTRKPEEGHRGNCSVRLDPSWRRGQRPPPLVDGSGRDSGRDVRMCVQGSDLDVCSRTQAPKDSRFVPGRRASGVVNSAWDARM